MNLYHLRYFSALAEVQHYTKAAEQLCITQPSLSYAISQLEEELQVPLFEKKGRQIVLSKHGQLFLSHVNKALHILDEGIHEMEMASKGEGRIEIGFLRTLGVDYIPHLTASFLKENREKSIQFGFHSGITSVLLKGLKEGIYDIVFCTKIEQEKSVEFIPVSKEDLVLIVPADHPLACRHTIDLNETLPYPQVFFAKECGMRTVVDDLFEKIDGRPIIAYETEEDQVIAGLVAQNFGIAVVPYMDMLYRLNVKIIQISSPVWERGLYMATLKDKYMSPVLQAFKDFVGSQTII